MAKGSPLDVKKAESITKELESLYDRRTKFGIKYLEGFAPEFQEEVDNTIKDSRTAKEEKIVQEQQVENAKRRDVEYDAATANKTVNNSSTMSEEDMELQKDMDESMEYDEAPEDYQETGAPEVQEQFNDDISEVEYNDFIDKGIVSTERLTTIADKVKNRLPLSEKETAIFNDKTADINVSASNIN